MKPTDASPEKTYVDVVIAGDFTRAASLFDQIAYPLRRVPGTELESRCSTFDWFLTRFVAFEGVKGAWCLRLGERALVYGFDEWLVVASGLSAEETAFVSANI